MFALTEPLPVVMLVGNTTDATELKHEPQQQHGGKDEPTSTTRASDTPPMVARPARPWSQCEPNEPSATACHLKFEDGHCDPQCNHERCLFDGWDCEPAANETQSVSLLFNIVGPRIQVYSHD